MSLEELEISPSKSSSAGIPSRQVANVVIVKSIYMSVVVASFGGVHYSMRKGHKVLVHPSWLLLSCLPVFCAQLTIIFALRVDLDLETDINDMGGESFGCLLSHVKLLLVGVVALIHFQWMLNSVRLLLFVLNPHSWVEVYNRREGLAGLHNRFDFLTLLSLTASLMPLVVIYIVCVDSISVIFASRSVHESVFNCLAISFVLELDGYWWEFLTRVFYVSSLDEFTFEVDEGGLTPRKADMFLCPLLMKTVLDWTSCLRNRSHGMQVVSLILLFGLYVRQLFVVLFAVETGILPAARDVCLQYHWVKDPNSFSASLAYVFDQFLVFVDITYSIQEVARTSLHDCDDDTYSKLSLDEAWRLGKKYPLTVWAGLAGFGIALLTPTIVYQRSLASRKRSYEMDDSDEDEEFDVSRHLYDNDIRLERLEGMFRTLLAQQRPALGGLSIPGFRGWE